MRLFKIVGYFITRALILAGAVLTVLFGTGCAQLPSVQACKVFKYDRLGDEYNIEARQCRVMQAPMPIGL